MQYPLKTLRSERAPPKKEKRFLTLNVNVWVRYRDPRPRLGFFFFYFVLYFHFYPLSMYVLCRSMYIQQYLRDAPGPRVLFPAFFGYPTEC